MNESGSKSRRRDWLDLGLIGSAHGLSDGYSNLLVPVLALASASYFAMQWAGGFTVLAVLAFLAGAGNAAYHPCGTALTAERFRHRRSFAISLHSLMGNLGAAVMPVVQVRISRLSSSS